MAQRPVMRFANRGWRDLPSPSTRVRGAGELPYNPRRPLTLPGDRNPRQRPQFRGDRVARLVLPLLFIGGLGVGVFFGVSYLLNDDPAATAADAAVAQTDGAETASGDAASTDAAGGEAATAGAAAVEATGDEAAPIDAAQVAAGAAGDATAEAATETGTAASPVATGETVVTAAQLGGAPASIERAGATPIPSGVSGMTLPDGSVYDPADESAALSSVWPAGTVLDVTRLPGGPLLTEEDAAQLIGRTIQVVVVGTGDFPTELQLSPAAYQRIARDFEPIIALQITVVSAPQ